MLPILFLLVKQQNLIQLNYLFINTGLPTKDDTSENTVQSLYCLFISVNLLFNKIINQPLNDYLQGKRLKLTLK